MEKTAYHRLMEAQEALRLWYKEHPGTEPPAWMVAALDCTLDAYRAECEHRERERARQQWESR